ncbi:class I SAM-dependent methyltransferase [Caballeronia telluris]|uniref:Methyltransferase regulatory domain protein n=1 Tax=Caballeronia telluris TaxID=326475 RepID=A0A158HRT2_9BURK|nr:class I SAM-dependent methyltransferase [Caballeronia telluris]SAL47094.1 putative methyltransferase regulatory domain protein [Caballeronia telluris]
MSWAAGYNNSVEYTTGYYQEQSPTWLKAALVMQRVAPPAEGKFTYCELGFGQGLTSLILAATHPQGDFYACDFNPLHVIAASSIRDDAQLPNLTLLENSFGELADGQVDLPMFDFVTLHGIVSWVSNETRAQIVRFLARYLKPGGVVQISYNAMAACAQVQPLQRLLTLHAGNRGEHFAGAAAFARQLLDTNALHFQRNPDAAARVKSFDAADQRYLVHEYMHEQWTPFHFTDMANELANAKLVYAGSARYVQMSPVSWLTNEQSDVINSIKDPMFAEEVRDYFCNRSFRSDVFVRGRAPLNDVRLREHAKRVHLWANPKAEYQPAVTLEHASVNRSEDAHRPLFDLLRSKPETTLDELFDAPGLAGFGIDSIMQLVRFSLAAGETSIRYGDVAPRAAADRLNTVLLDRAERGEKWDALASPKFAGGVPVGLLDQLLIAPLRMKRDPKAALTSDIDELVARAERSLTNSGLHLNVGSRATTREEMPAAIRNIFNTSGPALVALCDQNDLWPASDA